MVKIRDIIDAIEQVAPLPLQEGYDNAGLQVGDAGASCTGALLCVDVTPDIIREAVERGCNLVLSHHPLLFGGIKRLTGRTLQQQALIAAVKNDIAVYSAHTNLDSAPVEGVSLVLASLLGLVDVEPLQRITDKTLKLSVMVPEAHAVKVREAVCGAGVGRVGCYSDCSFAVKGEGTFKALDGADPYVGEVGKLHHESEIRVDVILPSWLRDKVERALLDAHPYEVPAYEFVRLDNPLPAGLGAVGRFPTAVDPMALVAKVKEVCSSPVARCTPVPDRAVTRVAVCGGSGGSLIGDAIASGAQAYITSDVRYHDFVDHRDDIFIIDIGHYESEMCTKQIFYHIVSEKFPNFALYYSELEKNPINYL